MGSAEPLLLYTSPRKSRIGSSVFMCNSSRADSQAVYHPLEPLSLLPAQQLQAQVRELTASPASAQAASPSRGVFIPGPWSGSVL